MTDNTDYSDLPPALQEQMESDPDFAEAVRKAQEGVFETTMMEMFVKELERMILISEAELTMSTVHSIITNFPFIQYDNVPQYQAFRVEILKAAAKRVDDILDGQTLSREELFTEAENDWTLHKSIYVDMVVVLNQLVNEWYDQWREEAWASPFKPVLHVALSDVSAFLIGEFGLRNQLSNLAGFVEFTDEENKEIHDRVMGLSDE